MSNVPGCYVVIPASVWIEYIFKKNAAALSILIILYFILLLSYILLFTKQINGLSLFNNLIDQSIRSFQRSAFYRQYYIPYIYHYGCIFLLFLVLLPISLMYYDSLFRYRNDCSSITNSWIIFSIIFIIQFWYICIRFIIYSPEFHAIQHDPHRLSTWGGSDWHQFNDTITPNISQHQQYEQKPMFIEQQQQQTTNYQYKMHQAPPPNYQPQYVGPSPSPQPVMLGYNQQQQNNINNINNNQQQSNHQIIGETDPESSDYNQFAPSVPSMNAPKPMQNEYYQEEEHGAIPDYNPFDDDNGNSNGEYVVVDEESDNNIDTEHPIPLHKISMMHNDESNQNIDTQQQTEFVPVPPPPQYQQQQQQQQQQHQEQHQPPPPPFRVIASDQQQQQQQQVLPASNTYNDGIQPQETYLPPPEARTPNVSMNESQQQQLPDNNDNNDEVTPYGQSEIRINKDGKNLEAQEYLQAIQMKQLIKYFKYISIFFMMIGTLIMTASWMFIPYYSNPSSYSFFYVFVAPFIIIYRINMRFMNGDYYNHYHYENILNDFPFTLFLLKMSSVLIIINFCINLASNPLDTDAMTAGMILLFILPICCIYPWYILGKISVQLRTIYDVFEAQHANNNDYTFIRPIIPFGEIPHSEPSGGGNNISYNEEEEKSEKLESIDLTTEEQTNQLYKFRESKHSVHRVVDDNSTKGKLKRIASTGSAHYNANKFWATNVIAMISCIISIIAGSVEASIVKKEMKSECKDDSLNDCFDAILRYGLARILVGYSVMLLLVIIYSVMVECYNKNSTKGISKKYYLMSSDTKGRLMVYLKTVLIMFKISIILLTKQSGTKVVFTILSFTSSTFLAVLTFNKKYQILKKLPVKYPTMFARSYMISYFSSSFVMFLMTIHAICVSRVQFLVIYSYIGLSFLWLFWSQFYNNEITHFISELNQIETMKMEQDDDDKNEINVSVEKFKIKQEKQIPTTFGSLHLLNELSMISSFIVFIICCAMASKSYDGAQDGGSLFFLGIYLILSCIIFINSFIAILSMQSKNQKVYKSAAFEPLLKESLLSQSL